ncbi:MAG TPA: M20 family metallo-hydrolase [Candidatus Methanomethylophilaceae archaeon]|nr:M20 family metallo-hydrolase [Candidatus Methanomethylophilaceae archaeon]
MELAAVLEKIERSRDRIIEEMCDMIRIPAISPANGGTGESRRADHMIMRLKGYDTVLRVDVPDDTDPSIMRSNILAKKRGKEEGTVWIVSHLDTVPTGNLEDWDSPPFEPRVEDGRIYGRGTEDNGQAVISSIFASEFIDKDILTGKSIGIALVADEENTSKMGIDYLIKNKCFSKDDIFIVPDWGSPGGSQIVVDEKDLIWLNFSISGRTTHGSTPGKGINAFRTAAHLIVELESEFNKEFPSEDQMFKPSISTFEPTRSTNHVENVNTIPGYYDFSIDVRLLPHYKIDDVVSVAEKVAEKIADEYGAEILVEEIQRHKSGKSSSIENETYLALRDSIKHVTGTEPIPIGIGGATCANFFRLAGYDAYVWGTGGGTLHTPNEYVEIDNIIIDAKVFATLFYKLCV